MTSGEYLKIFSAPPVLRVVAEKKIMRLDEQLYELQSGETLAVTGDKMAIGGTDAVIVTKGRVIISKREMNFDQY